MTTVVLKDGATKPILPTITVGRASTLEFEVVGAPDGLQEMQVHVSDAETPHAYSAVSARPLPGNRWHVYVSGLYFRTVGRAAYHLTGKDGRDNAVWLGAGRLEVVNSVLHADADAAPIVPEDCYIRNPATGLWHKVVATAEDGEIVLQYEKEGIER